jgi:hypothetical protein
MFLPAWIRCRPFLAGLLGEQRGVDVGQDAAVAMVTMPSNHLDVPGHDAILLVFARRVSGEI